MSSRRVSAIAVSTLSDGLASLVDIAPQSMTVFIDESDWALVGGDFGRAIDAVVDEDDRLQPPLPFESVEDNELVQAK